MKKLLIILVFLFACSNIYATWFCGASASLGFDLPNMDSTVSFNSFSNINILAGIMLNNHVGLYQSNSRIFSRELYNFNKFSSLPYLFSYCAGIGSRFYLPVCSLDVEGGITSITIDDKKRSHEFGVYGKINFRFLKLPTEYYFMDNSLSVYAQVLYTKTSLIPMCGFCASFDFEWID